LVNAVQGNNSNLLYHTKQTIVQYRYNKVVTLKQVVHIVQPVLNNLLLYWWYHLIIPINITTAQVKCVSWKKRIYLTVSTKIPILAKIPVPHYVLGRVFNLSKIPFWDISCKNRLISFMSIRPLSARPTACISMAPTGWTYMKFYINELRENLLGKINISEMEIHMKT
jgi:hypothetical protein